MLITKLIEEEMRSIKPMSKAQLLQTLNLTRHQLNYELQPLIEKETLLDYSRKKVFCHFEVAVILLYIKYGVELERETMIFDKKMLKNE